MAKAAAHPAPAESFSWDAYLKGCDDKPAPRSCFKQAHTPPANLFQLGHKLESRDPRNSMSYCIATVVYVKGPRLCLRLDGSDNRNDFWSLADSADIHPYGWTEKNGDQLQPPLGFSKNASTWPSFLSKLLAESMEYMAPEACFKPVPETPGGNQFQVGMKLEAMDRKNPQLILPATVGEIDGDKILVQFDGWRGAFDYWCRYDSRDIFPVGWCAATGHVLQPPGTKGNLPRGRASSSSKSQSVSPNMAVHVDTFTGCIPSPGSARSAGSKKHSPALPLVSPAASVSPGASETGIHVTAHINQTCQCGPVLKKTSIIRLPLHYGPAPILRVLRKVVQAIIDSATSPALIFNNLVHGASSSTVMANVNGKVNACNLPQISSEAAFMSYVSNLLESIECCKNLVTLNNPLRQACNLCSRLSPSTSHVPKRSLSITEPEPPIKRPRQRGRPAKVKKSHSRSLKSPASIHPDNDTPMYGHQNSVASLVSPGARNGTSSINPWEWSTDDVIQFIRSSDPSLAKYAHLIQSNEIDGRALLLITSDILIKYMNMKVGPAVKLCGVIDQLRLSL